MLHSLLLRCKLQPTALLLAGLLAGCGGGGGTTSPPVDALTNPDKIVFSSGRTADAVWRYYAMNPDGSGVTQVPGLSTLAATEDEGIELNQNGTLAIVLETGLDTTTRQLIRLSDGTVLYTIAGSGAASGLAANSTGSQLAVAGQPTSGDPYAIYLLNPDGTHKSQVAAVASGDTVSDILFAPDDQTLYYVETAAAPGNAGTLYKLVSGGTPVALANVNAPIRSVHTSRDGTKLAFIAYTEASDQSSLTFTAYTLKADGTGLTKGATSTITEAVAPWNVGIASRADGFHVLYVDTIGGAEDIADMRPDGSGLKQITFNAAGNASPGSRAATVGTIHAPGGR